jgi:hypothetical protein
MDVHGYAPRMIIHLPLGLKTGESVRWIEEMDRGKAKGARG